MEVLGEITLFGGGVGSGGLGDPGELEAVAGGVAFLLSGEKRVSFGIAVGDEGRDEGPAILLAEIDTGDGALFLEEVFQDGLTGGLGGESAERAEPDDAEIVGGIAGDLIGGQGSGAGDEFGLGLRAT